MALMDDGNLPQCGFCAKRNEALQEPKCLPCGHVHCLSCLSDSFETIDIVQCPTEACRKVFDVTLSSLPTHNIEGADTDCCDVHVKKKRCDEKANVYCTQCSKRFCTKHGESHDDMFENHTTISIEEFETQKARQQMRMCEVHKDQPYSDGCKKCLKVFCGACLFKLGNCTDGGSHQTLPLNDLTELLEKEIGDLKNNMTDKEKALDEIFEITSKKITEYDEATEIMVQLIHQTRDEQVNALNEKYQKLENDLVEARSKVRVEMVEFLEQKVGANLREIKACSQNINAAFKPPPQCDFLTGYKKIKHEVQELIEDLLPSLNIPKVTSLYATGRCRDIELNVINAEGVQIFSEQKKTIPNSPPRSLTLLDTAELPNLVTSVCCYKGYTYIGSKGGFVTKIDGSFQQSNFIKLDKHVGGLTIYKDKVYSKLYSGPNAIQVHDFSKRLLQVWDHTDSEGWYAGIAVCSDKLIVPDRLNEQLVVYTLTGSVVKRIDCADISSRWVSLCAVGDDCVVVSDYKVSRVCMIDINTGKIKWTSEELAGPQGVTCYKGKYVIVASRGSNTLNIIDANTGIVVSEMTHQEVCGSGDYIFDMDISGNTLVIANNSNSSAVFFQLNL